MAPPALLPFIAADYVLALWHDGRVLLETPAPVTLRKRLALSVLCNTASEQAALKEDVPC